MSDSGGVISDSGATGVLGLARSCRAGGHDWIHQGRAAPGIATLEASFQGRAYRQHRHDTYAIGVTEVGVQAFGYRGETHISTPGEVVVLHPDELHDGYAGADGGFGYRLLYIEPALIFAAGQGVGGRRGTLPFARQPVLRNPALADVIRGAFTGGLEQLAVDDLLSQVTLSLIEADASQPCLLARHKLDDVAIERARSFLDAERTRVVRSEELEAVTGLSRHDLARQFRAALGTSPYRYSLLRRLDVARDQLGGTLPLVEIALGAGFADQAHFTRMFTAAFGISPGRYRALGRRCRTRAGADGA